MTLRRVREFTAPTDERTARALVRQLGELEDNAADETADIRKATLPILKPLERAEASSGVVLAPGQSLGIDTTDGGLDVILEAPSAKHAGLPAMLFKRVAANTVTLRPAGGSLINGAATKAITARGLTVIFCDGVEYWA